MQPKPSRSRLVLVALLNPIALNNDPQRSKSWRRAWLRLALVAVGLATAWSCLSPTLPLPPPNRPDVEGPDVTGNVTLSGAVVPGGQVYANNLNNGQSAGQRANPQTGQYRFKLGARVGDAIDFFYIYDSATSEHLYFNIADPTAPANSSPFSDTGIIFAPVDASVPPPR